jgi:hypothetical protein
MKKDDAIGRREKVLKALNEALAGLGHAPLVDDGRLYHEEVAGENRWAQRLSRPEWPHIPAGQAPVATPGLRYEVWYFQKQEVAWIALLYGRRPAMADLTRALTPLWREWIESGKYARRYHPLDAVWTRSYPETDGIWRSVPLDDKLDRGLLTLVRDTLPVLEKLIAGIDPEGMLAGAFRQAGQARDPLAELADRFKVKPR